MDLGTIRRRLNNNCYQSAQECLEVLFLMFRNCYIYNAPGDDVVLMALRLESKARAKLQDMPYPEVEVTAQRPRKGNATASNRSAYSSQTATVTSNIEGLNGSFLVPTTASSGDALQAPLQRQWTSTIVQKRAPKRKLDPPSLHCTNNANEHSQIKKSKGDGLGVAFANYLHSEIS